MALRHCPTVLCGRSMCTQDCLHAPRMQVFPLPSALPPLLHVPQAYQGAVQALGACADRLRSSPGRFFFGDKPSSLDALLFGHLAFYKHSPVAAPVLRDKVRLC
jgi:hypothetical protein